MCNKNFKGFWQTFKNFWLKANKFKCEIAGIDALKGLRRALSSMQCTNLNEKTDKILGIHYCYNEKFQEEKPVILMSLRLQMFQNYGECEA